MVAYNLGSKIEIIMVSFGVLMLLIVVGGIVALGTYLGRLAGGKVKGATRFLCLLPTVSAILISVAGFVLNMGWCRFGLLFLMVPVWYTLLLIVSSSASAPVMKHSSLVKTAYIFSHILYVVSGLILPDGGDIGPSYVFFGLINNYPDGLEMISILMFAGSIALMIIQIVTARKLSKRDSVNACDPLQINE